MKQIKNTHPNADSQTRFVTADYLAGKYRVTSRYILQMAAAERIPCFRLGKKCVRFDEADVAAVLERSGTNGHNAP